MKLKEKFIMFFNFDVVEVVAAKQVSLIHL